MSQTICPKCKATYSQLVQCQLCGERWDLDVGSSTSRQAELMQCVSTRESNASLSAERNRLESEVGTYGREVKSLREDVPQLTEGVKRISAERDRQIAVEGWIPEHDDAHSCEELAIAAACYAVQGTDCRVWDMVLNCDGWPWDGWDKRKEHTRERRLEIAGALIAAELDRLDRAAAEAVKAENP